MPIRTTDIVSLARARAGLSELARQVREEGREKLLTRNGDAYVALVDARRLEHYHALEQSLVQIELLAEVEAGLDDVKRGRTRPARAYLKRRAAKP